MDLKGSIWRWGLGEVIPVINADSRPRCCTIPASSGCCAGDTQYCQQGWAFFSTGCSCMRNVSGCRPPRPHTCSCYRYRSQIIHTGECIKVAGQEGASYLSSPRASNSYVQTAFCNNPSCMHAHQLYSVVQHMKCSGDSLGAGMGSADQLIGCHGCYSFCFDGKMCTSGCLLYTTHAADE